MAGGGSTGDVAALRALLQRVRPAVVVAVADGERREIRPRGQRDRWTRVAEAVVALDAQRAELLDQDGGLLTVWAPEDQSLPSSGPDPLGAASGSEGAALLRLLAEAQRQATAEHRALLRDVASTYERVCRLLAERAGEAERTVARLLERVQQATVDAAEARAQAVQAEAEAQAEAGDVGEVLEAVGTLVALRGSQGSDGGSSSGS